MILNNVNMSQIIGFLETFCKGIWCFDFDFIYEEIEVWVYEVIFLGFGFGEWLSQGWFLGYLF